MQAWNRGGLQLRQRRFNKRDRDREHKERHSAPQQAILVEIAGNVAVQGIEGDKHMSGVQLAQPAEGNVQSEVGNARVLIRPSLAFSSGTT